MVAPRGRAAWGALPGGGVGESDAIGESGVLGGRGLGAALDAVRLGAAVGLSQRQARWEGVRGCREGRWRCLPLRVGQGSLSRAHGAAGPAAATAAVHQGCTQPTWLV